MIACRLAADDGQVISPNHLIANVKAPAANVDRPKVEVWGMTPSEIQTCGAGRG
jgi:hypothetical protein